MTLAESATSADSTPRNDLVSWRDGLAIAGLALATRLLVVTWAWTRIPPAVDGAYYHVVAERIAAGHGYTWLWPDGVVTYAAHYPVGYPALIGALYALFGSEPGVAMLANAVLGALGVLGAHRIAAALADRRGAIVGGLVVAFHPGLVAYTPALMTEGVVASLLTIAGGIAVEARTVGGRRGALLRAALGIVLGATTLVRPQSVLVAPCFGWIARRAPGGRSSLRSATLVAAVAVAAVMPWTLRNCFVMGTPDPGRFNLDACSFVSANGGWNLLIGAGPGANGHWVSVEEVGFPEECREVFGEAEKDRCFGRAGLRHVREDPWRWLALAPAKLAGTFDASGAAGYYLATANPNAFGSSVRRALDVVETVWQRLVLLAALAALWRARRGETLERGHFGGWAQGALALGSMAAACTRSGWIAYIGFCLGALGLGRALGRHPPLALAAAVVGTTALAHVLFFGAGRYSLVTFGVLGALAGVAATARSASPSVHRKQPATSQRS